MTSPFAYPGSVSDLDNIASGGLVPPDTAAITATRVDEMTGEVAPSKWSWVDTVSLNDVAFEAPKKPMRNQQDGDQVGILVLKATIDPVGGSKSNHGRRVMGRFIFNMTALSRDDGHTKMTQRSFSNLYSLVSALGLEKSAAIDPSEFPNHKPMVVGRRLRVLIEQEKQDGGRTFVNLGAFSPTEE